MIIYEHQEGRGIGLMNKLRAYELQDLGADTVEANEQLGFKADHREYQLPGSILKYFGIRQVRLLSNNPDKRAQLTAAGIEVAAQLPTGVFAGSDNMRYLHAKVRRTQHTLELPASASGLA